MTKEPKKSTVPGAKRISLLILCVFAAGCGGATLAKKEIQPKNSADGGAVEARVRAPSDGAVPSPERARSEARAKPPRATLRAGLQDAREDQPLRDALGAAAKPPDEEAIEVDKDIEPSPHDLSLPIPEVEEEADVPPSPPAAAAPKAASYDVPVVRNALVDRWIDYFTGQGRANFSIWLSRSGRYLPLFREILKERGLPQDLAYLPLIESGFSSRARSRAGAVGQWQFMPGTARIMGLKINFYVDERRHPIKSTRAAATYLSKLYEEFGDWHLALASYNAGERRVMRAMRRSGKKNYWSLVKTRHLPNETRQYIAKYLAGMIIAKNPEAFGFKDVPYQESWNYKAVPLPHGVSLKAVSRAAGVPLPALRKINAEFRTSVTPPRKGYRVFLPREKAEGLGAKLAKLPKARLRASRYYRIRPGDTLGAIAKRFRIPLRRLMALNARLHPKRLRPGRKVLLSRHGESPGTARRRLARANGSPAAPGTHVVRRGESLWVIARKRGVSIRQLTRLNPGLRPKRIRIGAKIRLPAPKPKRPAKAEEIGKERKNREKSGGGPSHHLVGPGENVWLIARRYGVSTKSLLAWNRLSDSAMIFPGNRLIIRR